MIGLKFRGSVEIGTEYVRHDMCRGSLVQIE